MLAKYWDYIILSYASSIIMLAGVLVYSLRYDKQARQQTITYLKNTNDSDQYS